MEQILRTEDGRELRLGNEDELAAAVEDIRSATGGSSGGGLFSLLFGLGPGEVSTGWALRLGEEAAEFRRLIGVQLRDETVALLDRLSVWADSSLDDEQFPRLKPDRR